MLLSRVVVRWVLSFIAVFFILFASLTLYAEVWANHASGLYKFYYEFVMLSIMIAVCAGYAIAPRHHAKIADLAFIGIGIAFYSHNFAGNLVLGKLAPANLMEFGSSLVGGVLAFVMTRGIHVHVPHRHHRRIARPTP
jgi:hypothetical protein